MFLKVSVGAIFIFSVVFMCCAPHHEGLYWWLRLRGLGLGLGLRGLGLGLPGLGLGLGLRGLGLGLRSDKVDHLTPGN